MAIVRPWGLNGRSIKEGAEKQIQSKESVLNFITDRRPVKIFEQRTVVISAVHLVK